METLYITDSFRQKPVGEIDRKNKVFIKKVKDSLIFRKANAIGLDLDIFMKNLYEDNYTIYIDLIDRVPKQRIGTTAKNFKANGFILNFTKYGKQIFLPMDKFEKVIAEPQNIPSEDLIKKCRDIMNHLWNVNQQVPSLAEVSSILVSNFNAGFNEAEVAYRVVLQNRRTQDVKPLDIEK